MHRETLERIWPEWRIEQRIGKGAYGSVYRAVRQDHNLVSFAAIKVISIPKDESEIDALLTEGRTIDGVRAHLHGIVQSCLNEIQLMQSFKGTPNIVGIDDYKVVPKTGSEGWELYIRMDLLTPLTACIKSGVLTEQEVIRIGIDICSALELCSQKRIIHRDIKPENIFVNEFGYYKLGDFGIARQLEDMNAGLTRAGTLNYIAPEVASGNYDHRADIYSLGLTLYYLLNGNCLPFVNRDAYQGTQSAFERRLRGEALPVPSYASPAMTDVVLRACAYSPGSRFSTATELKHALQQVAAGTYVPVRPVYPANPVQSYPGYRPQSNPGYYANGHTGYPVQPPQSVQKKSKAGLIAGISAAAVLVLIAGFVFLGGRDKPEPEEQLSAEDTRPAQRDTEPAEQETQPPAEMEDSEDVKVSAGTVSGENYENSFLGLGYTLDDGWLFLSEAELAEENGITGSLQDADLDLLIDQNGVVQILGAGNGVDNLNIMLEKIPEGYSVTEKQMLEIAQEAVSASLENSGMSILDSEIVKVTFMGQTHYAFCYTIHYDGYSFQAYGMQLAVIRDGYIAAVTITASSEEYLDDILANFYPAE